MVVASLGLGTRIVTELTVLELRGHGKANINNELMRGVATTVTCSSSWNQDRVELEYFEQLKKDSTISPTKRAALDHEYAVSSLLVAPPTSNCAGYKNCWFWR